MVRVLKVFVQLLQVLRKVINVADALPYPTGKTVAQILYEYEKRISLLESKVLKKK